MIVTPERHRSLARQNLAAHRLQIVLVRHAGGVFVAGKAHEPADRSPADAPFHAIAIGPVGQGLAEADGKLIDLGA